MSAGAAEHWDSVYGTRPTDEVSWFQREATTSLRLIASVCPPTAAVVDIGAGASRLVDTLLDVGWSDVTVLDVSATALSLVHDRITQGVGDPPRDRAGSVSFVVADVLTWQPERAYDAWHDRAVFHFLARPDQRELYVARAANALPAGAAIVLGTFAADGPTQCSGLPTARYDADGLAAVFEPGFRLEHAEREEHVTPSGVVQPFTWAVLRRT